MAMSREYWNRCDDCGRFISVTDFEHGDAVRKLVYPDSDRTRETWETLCRYHVGSNPEDEAGE
jgi:hypothetical protein